jgi:hypothetical protein
LAFPRQRGFFAVIQPLAKDKEVLMKKILLQGNAEKLLREYRPALWRKSALESVSGTGRKTLQTCAEQIRFTQGIVDVLRSKKLLGEKFYWIIYTTYLTDRQPENVDEILSEIARKYKVIPRRTYFRLKNRAIKLIDECLSEISQNEFAA